MAEFVRLYRHSFSEAKQRGELDVWRASQSENIRCRDFLDAQVRQNYRESHLDSESIVKSAIAEFGWDRTRWVLAAHVQHYDYDGRFSQANKAWAQKFSIPRPTEEEQKRDPYLRDHTTDFLLQSHNVLADGVVTGARKLYNGLNLYDHRHREPGDVHEQDFTGKVLLLRDDVLKESCRTPENQLFLANLGGFGCKPEARGRTVMGTFLIDGEKARFNREDFLGVCDPAFLPDWAKATQATVYPLKALPNKPT